MSVDDLYHILFTHWVYDDATYADERQRVQVATGILLASFTGCRPCSLFDTSLKKYNDDESVGRQNHCSDDGELDEDKLSEWESGDNGPRDDIDPGTGFDRDDIMSQSDSDDGENDDCNTTRLQETASIRYRDVSMFVLRDSVPGGPNVLAAKVTLVNTKGGERKSYSSMYALSSPGFIRILTFLCRKTFVFTGENDPMFCILTHLLALAIHDQAFEVEAFRTSPAKIFHCEIPLHKKCLALKWRAEILDNPIFRQPTKSTGVKSASVWSTPQTAPLKSSTWLRYLKRLGLNAGLEHPFTQYSIRRGALDAINGKLTFFTSIGQFVVANRYLTTIGRAPDSVRNQIFDHASSAPARWYLNQEIKLDTEAAYLERPSNTLV
jgi:hypothetical protein